MPDRLNLIGFTELEKEILVLATRRLKENMEDLPEEAQDENTKKFFVQLDTIINKLAAAEQEPPRYPPII